MMRLYLIFLFFYLLPTSLLAQKNYADSIKRIIDQEKVDTLRVNLLCDIAFEIRDKDPNLALKLAGQALALSKEINYQEGHSKSLGTMAIIFRLIGNFPLALEYNLKRLKIVEQSSSLKKIAGTLVNIGFVYVSEEEYAKGLSYYYKGDSVINQMNPADDDNKFTLALNFGDVYDKMNVNDSAFNYFTKALSIARQLKNKNYEGMAMIGLGNSFVKTDQYNLAIANYQTGIVNLKEAENDDLLCEAYIGLANLYKKLNKKDSSVFYARLSFLIAQQDGFLPRHLEAAKFLSFYFKTENNIDSAFYYLNFVQDINDSINSKSRIRESQLISSNEQERQMVIAENLKIAKRERKQQLQLLFIAIFIPGFFVLTLLLSRIKLPIKLIKVLGILSLLILFEYLTLLLHPYVKEITHHTPIYEMLIFVSIAAILIPTHHRIELWLINWLTKNRPLFAGSKLKMRKSKITKKVTEV